MLIRIIKKITILKKKIMIMNQKEEIQKHEHDLEALKVDENLDNKEWIESKED